MFKFGNTDPYINIRCVDRLFGINIQNNVCNFFKCNSLFPYEWGNDDIRLCNKIITRDFDLKVESNATEPYVPNCIKFTVTRSRYNITTPHSTGPIFKEGTEVPAKTQFWFSGTIII